MPHAHDADETVAEQCLHTQFRSRRLADNAGFQIDDSVAKWRAVLVGLLHEAQPHAGRFLANAGNEVRPEVLHKAFAGPQRERSDQLFEVELSLGAAPLRPPAPAGLTCSRSSSARGVGTRPRPALTSSGSPVVSRNRASARLIADGLSRKRRAARATLPSASSTSRVTSRLRSGCRHASTIAQPDRDMASTHE
jgi:hypothetical protein